MQRIYFELTIPEIAGTFDAEKTKTGEWYVHLRNFDTATHLETAVTTSSDAPWVVIHEGLAALEHEGLPR